MQDICDTPTLQALESLVPPSSERRWRHVPDFEGLYAISSDGHLVSLPREVQAGNKKRTLRIRLMKPTKRMQGGKIVSISANLSDGATGTHKFKSYASMMLEGFVEARPSPEHVAHAKNGIQEDLRLDNLEWTTPRLVTLKHIHGAEAVKEHQPEEMHLRKLKKKAAERLFLRIEVAAKTDSSILLSSQDCKDLCAIQAVREGAASQARELCITITPEGFIRMAAGSR